MNQVSPILLIGVGGAGCAIAHGVNRAFGESMRHVLCDTDAVSARENSRFILLGGDRLSGHGSGGDVAQARLAAEDSKHAFDECLDGVRLAVIVTSLGGGTGGGATLEILKHLRQLGIPGIVFATLPFSFEGEERACRARGITSMIEEAAGAAIFTQLDNLIDNTDNMAEAMRRAVDTLASGVTLFWRILQKPGYIRLDTERVKKIIATAGRGRFATVSVQGPARAGDAVDALSRSPLLAANQGPVRSILLGILAGDDLRLSEIGTIADGVRDAFGRQASFDLATVNDESTFSGRLSTVLMLFEAGRAQADDGEAVSATGQKRRRRDANPLAQGPKGRGRFTNVEPTIYNGEDLDVPTFSRRNIILDI